MHFHNCMKALLGKSTLRLPKRLMRIMQRRTSLRLLRKPPTMLDSSGAF